VVAVREAKGHEGNDRDRTTIDRTDEVDAGLWEPSVRLGQDVRLVLVAIGGGGVRIGREIARRHLRFVETIAINCDPRVANADEFDRRICLGAEDGLDLALPTSAGAAGQIARAAGPALDRLFDGATFVTVVATLGGSSGTGVLGPVLESASRSAEVLSVFVVKPFAFEIERRALAERSIAALHFLDAFVEKHQRRQATLTVLDNEELRRTPGLALRDVARDWANRISDHIQESMITPSEALLDAERIGTIPLAEPPSSVGATRIGPISPDTAERPPLAPHLAPAIPAASADVELTFEVVASPPRGLELH
jgi:hypothetical protein